jgi:hypothetical protein
MDELLVTDCGMLNDNVLANMTECADNEGSIEHFSANETYGIKGVEG